MSADAAPKIGPTGGAMSNPESPPDNAGPRPGTGSDTGSGTSENDPKRAGQFGYYLRVFKYTDRTGWILNAFAISAMVVSGTVLPLMDIVFGKFVTIFNDFSRGLLSPSGYREEVNRFTLYYVYLFVGKFVLTYIWTLLVAVTAMRTTKALRVDFLRQTLRQDIAFFDLPTSSSISGQVTTNGNLVNQGISEKLGLIIQACSMFITAFIVAFAIQWKLTLIIVGIVPVNLAVTAVCVVFDTIYEYRIFDIYSRAGSLAQEVFASVRTVHAFWAYPKLSKKFEAILEEARVVGMRKSPVYAILFSVEFFCIYSGYGLAFWRGIRMYASGEISDPGTIVTVIFAVIVAAQALTQIAPQTMSISKAAAAAQELFQTIDRPSRIDSLSSSGLKPTECVGDIQVSDIHFSYPSRPTVKVLNGLNLSIPANKTTALVGASGSGKSTIVGLLERWYTPSQGRITLDGVEIQDLNVQWLRTNIRLVQQEPTLFGGTIFDNIAYGLTGTVFADLSQEDKQKRVEEACKSAFAHEFINDLPDGYLTNIGERGASLSGGQKQRLVIARSIISDPQILLLDEATSALDPTAEKIVQEALNNVAVGRTRLVIAHKLSTIREADKIVVLESQGRVVEQGNHAELMACDGAYARLVRTQDLGHRGDDEETANEKVLGEVDTIQKEGDEVVRHESEVHAHDGQESGGDNEAIVDHGLIKCIWLVFKEQRSLWHPFFWMMLGFLIGGATYPAVAILFSKTMVAFEHQGSEMTARGDFFSLMFFVVAIGNLVGYAMLGVACNIISQEVIKAYKLELFDNTIKQKMTFFDHPTNTAGALVSRLSSEPTNLQELMSANLGLIFVNVVNLLSSCVLAIIVGWKLGLVLVFGALPPLVFSGWLRIRLEYRLDKDTAARFASSSGLAAEAVMAIRTVSSLALEREILNRYVVSLEGISKRSIKSLGWRMFWYSLSQSISFLTMALGFWYGGRLISTGEYTSSQFYTVFIAVIFSGESAAIFFQFSTSITKARVSANYIFGLRKKLSMPTNPPEGGDMGDREPGEDGTIECRDLEFSYAQRPHVRVLKGVNAIIQSGQFAAFVGASGCGKTTMISLMARFYDPTSGRIDFGGTPITAQDTRSYRAKLALVQQEPVLYQGSIRENIGLGIEGSEPSEEEIVAACKQANIHDFVISLPEGLGTRCGGQGLQLSGGQRQRIAIARALIRQPRLLLLDEATSALDTVSEKVVKAALDNAAEGRTTISVAHRLSTIKDADIIFVFSHGRIVESGKHERLLQKKGVYYEMCLGQSLDRTV